MAIIKSTDDITHPCFTPDFTRKLVSASELMVHEKFNLMYLNTERLPVIFVEWKQLDTVEFFNYLGSCITTEGGAERDIKGRIGKARSAFIRLDNIWKTTAFSKKTKFKLYNSCVLSVLLYGSFYFPFWCPS
jgi:hypothetical protein